MIFKKYWKKNNGKNRCHNREKRYDDNENYKCKEYGNTKKKLPSLNLELGKRIQLQKMLVMEFIFINCINVKKGKYDIFAFT